MAAKSKVVNHQEVLRWFAEKRTYAWMVEQYRTQYYVNTSLSMWSEIRHRHGLDRRNIQDNALLPWRVEERHGHRYPAVMLRLEARRRRGRELSSQDLGRLRRWLSRLDSEGVVIDYDPTMEEGFQEVAREVGDVDIVRAPRGVAGRRKRADRRR